MFYYLAAKRPKMSEKTTRRLFILHIFLSIAIPAITQKSKIGKVRIQRNEDDDLEEFKDNKVINEESSEGTEVENSTDINLHKFKDNSSEIENDEDIEAELAKFAEQPRLAMKRRPKTFDVIKLTPAQMQKFKIWDDGIIPYYIDVVSYSDKVFRDIIRNFLHKTNSIAGVNFVELPVPPKNKKHRWVFFVNRRGKLDCADHSVKDFTNTGVQKVILGYDCTVSKGELAEAVMSIVGIPAQHNAPDRDRYVTINTESILPDKRQLFEKVKEDEWLFKNLAYDFQSSSHFDMNKYSAEGHATIVPKDESQDISPSKMLSQTDVLKIKMIYDDIVKQQHLHETECQKLFQPRNKFERYTALHQKQKNINNKNINEDTQSDTEVETDSYSALEKDTDKKEKVDDVLSSDDVEEDWDLLRLDNINTTSLSTK